MKQIEQQPTDAVAACCCLVLEGTIVGADELFLDFSQPLVVFEDAPIIHFIKRGRL
jgi:hypothetical protein